MTPKYRVLVYPARDIPEEPITHESVNRISLIDNDSHGPVSKFGVMAMEVGEVIAYLSSPNVTTATVERIS